MDHGRTVAGDGDGRLAIRAQVGARRAIVAPAARAAARMDDGRTHADLAAIGQGAECAAGAGVGALQTVARHAGREVRIDDRRPMGRIAGPLEPAHSMHRARFDTLAALVASTQEVAFRQGAGRPQWNRGSQIRRHPVEVVGHRPDRPGKAFTEKSPPRRMFLLVHQRRPHNHPNPRNIRPTLRHFVTDSLRHFHTQRVGKSKGPADRRSPLLPNPIIPSPSVSADGAAPADRHRPAKPGTPARVPPAPGSRRRRQTSNGC